MNFCSRTALASHEVFAGTGVRARAYVFLPVPKRLWRDSELNSGWAAPDELKAIREARSGGVVTRLYNPPREGDAPALVYQGDAPARGEALEPLLALAARRWAVDGAQAPRLAVCTHGTRDRCCAKWGFAVFNRARELRAAGRSPFEPLECSHLGGDRFAATGIVLPSGSMYAHLDAVDLETLLAAEAAGRLWPTYYRGRVFEPVATQVVRAGLARDGIVDGAASPLSLQPREDGALSVTTADGRRFRVRIETAEVTFFPSCAKLAEGRPSRGRQPVYAGAEPLPA